jgi:hypothetical protein
VVEVVDDAGVVQRRQHPRLAREPGQPAFGRPVEQLDRDLCAIAPIPSAPDRAHAPPAGAFLEVVCIG